MPRVDILDHGYLEVVESWGSDERIVEAARMSTGKGFLGWGPKCATCGDMFSDPERECPKPSGNKPLVDCGRGGHKFDAPGDEKLLRYLYDNKHATPFEMAGLVVEVQAPIFVFREWHRHRTQSYNEMSARYAPLPDLYYVPDADLVSHRIDEALLSTNKQAKPTTPVPAKVDCSMWVQDVWNLYGQAEALYQSALRAGIPKELARIVMPVGHYSRMRCHANLRNWLAFLTLRMDPAAQWEIRQYADAVGDLVSRVFPQTWALFQEEWENTR